MFKKISALFKRGKKNIAILVDGPNMIRKEFSLDLSNVIRIMKKYGKIRVANVYLDQYASDKLIEAATNQGFKPVIVPSDVDVILAVEFTEYALDKYVDLLVLVTRDSDFVPAVRKAKERGKEVYLFTDKRGLSAALKNTVDRVFYIGDNGESTTRKNS